MVSRGTEVISSGIEKCRVQMYSMGRGREWQEMTLEGDMGD